MENDVFDVPLGAKGTWNFRDSLKDGCGIAAKGARVPLAAIPQPSFRGSLKFYVPLAPKGT